MASDLRGYTEQETLNKVLNTDNDSIQVDIVDATGVTITTSNDSVYADDADWTDSTSKHTLVGGLYQSTPQSITDGDVGPFQVDADGALHISDGGNAITVDGTVTANLGTTDNAVLDAMAASLALLDNSIASGNELQVDVVAALPSGSNTIGKVDLGTTDNAVLDAIAASLSVLDDWDDSNFANVNMNLAGSDAQAGEGTISATTQRVTIATDDDGVAHLATIAGAVSTQMQVDVVAALPAGTNTIGKVEAVGDVAENENAAGNPVLTGGRYDSSVRTLGNTDVGALALDPTGALYTREFLGQAGSILVTGTSNAVTTGVSGTKFVAIQFLEDTTFDTGSTGLVASTTGLWPDDANASTTIDGDGGATTGSEVFPQGMTIFGRWDGFKLDSGKVIGYLGYV